MDDHSPPATNFIEQAIADDLTASRCDALVTRFPPEPNGYLHIGHAKAICLNFGLSEQANQGVFGPNVKGRTHLRFDDTNPAKEEQRYIDAIKEDVRWLGFDWGEHEHHASDYFEQLYKWAILLIEAGKAYVDDQSADEVRQGRGTLTEPGVESPCRGRPIEENLDLFKRMKAGEFADGQKVLRARIDMTSPNLNLRDPVMYRILHATHPRTGDAWSIYPTYDWAHGQSDAIEGITHSLCTLEFEDHRPLYEWFLSALRGAGAFSGSGATVPPPPGEDGRGEVEGKETPNPTAVGPHARMSPPPTPPGGRGATSPARAFPRQIEFARLNLADTVMSKRKLLALVQEGHVTGWDDPRMPTLAGLRRRGYTPQAIRTLCARVGITKHNSTTETALLEHCLREDLNKHAPRRMAVLNPLKVVIENYPEGQDETVEAINNPEDESAGTRPVPFSRELYIERDDFMEDPPRKFYRLGPGREVRLRYGYFITCTGVIKNDAGEVTELRCAYDPETRGGNAPDGRKPKGTIHWVSAAHAVEAEVRLIDALFDGDKFNPDSLKTITGCKVEPALADAKPGEPVQFERLGYFVADSKDFSADRPVFNRTVTLKDTWAKMQKKK